MGLHQKEERDDGANVYFGNDTELGATVHAVHVLVSLFPRQRLARVRYTLTVTGVRKATLTMPLPVDGVVSSTYFGTPSELVPAVPVPLEQARTTARNEELMGRSASVASLSGNQFHMEFQPLDDLRRTVHVDVVASLQRVDARTMRLDLPATFRDVVFGGTIDVVPAALVEVDTNMPSARNAVATTEPLWIRYTVAPAQSAVLVPKSPGENLLCLVTPREFLESQQGDSADAKRAERLGVVVDFAETSKDLVGAVEDALRAFRDAGVDATVVDLSGQPRELDARHFGGPLDLSELQAFGAAPQYDRLVLLFSGANAPFYEKHPFCGCAHALPVDVLAPPSTTVCKRIVFDDRLERIAVLTGGVFRRHSAAQIADYIGFLRGATEEISVQKISLTGTVDGVARRLEWSDLDALVEFMHPDPLLSRRHEVKETFRLVGRVRADVEGRAVTPQSVVLTVARGALVFEHEVPIEPFNPYVTGCYWAPAVAPRPIGVAPTADAMRRCYGMPPVAEVDLADVGRLVASSMSGRPEADGQAADVHLVPACPFVDAMDAHLGKLLIDDVVVTVPDAEHAAAESARLAQLFGIPAHDVAFLLLVEAQQFVDNGLACPVNHPRCRDATTPRAPVAASDGHACDTLSALFRLYRVGAQRPLPDPTPFEVDAPMTHPLPVARFPGVSIGSTDPRAIVRVDAMRTLVPSSSDVPRYRSLSACVDGPMEDAPQNRSLSVDVDSPMEDALHYRSSAYDELDGALPANGLPDCLLPADDIVERIKAVRGPSAALELFEEWRRGVVFDIKDRKLLFNCGTALFDQGVEPAHVSRLYRTILCFYRNDLVSLRTVAYALMMIDDWTNAVDCLLLCKKLGDAEPISYIDLATAKLFAAKCATTAAEEYTAACREAVALLLVVLTRRWAGKYADYQAEMSAIVLLSWAVDSCLKAHGVDLWPAALPRNFFFLPRLFCQMGWDTDNTDLDLHVYEPEGTEVFYRHPFSPRYPEGGGGALTKDVTTGFGKEMYFNTAPRAGDYTFHTKYYANHASDVTGGTTVLLFCVSGAGTPSESIHLRAMRLDLMSTSANEGKIELHRVCVEGA